MVTVDLDVVLTPLEVFHQGCVIPAHPLALTPGRGLDERRQRALTRYYIDAGAGGVAVGVHTTQFALRERGLLGPVLELTATTARESGTGKVALVAGACGPTAQAVREAELAASFGYHLALLAPHPSFDEDQLVERARAVGEVLPIVGFYLQPAVGGCNLSRAFWTKFASLESTVGIKVAAFNRYHTLDVLHGVARSGRADEIALYTGNDDHILADLVAEHIVVDANMSVPIGFVGGMLGQWAVWTHRAVELLADARAARQGDDERLRLLLSLDGQLTDANAAIFDVAHAFRGCIPGIHEVLRRQGLLAGRWCLDPAEDLSPGQLDEIDRICAAYPTLRDDDFVAAHLDSWLAP